jgi:hypothetical protein
MKSGMRVALLLAMGCCVAVAQQAEVFEFHSGFWVNLHQFLFDRAMDQKSPPSGSAAWQEAVDYYRREVVKHNLLDDDMAALNNRLARAGGAATLTGAGVDAPLAAVLEKAAVEYRRLWWPEHDKGNRAWIEAARPLIARYGAAMKKDIAAAFQTEWPREAIRTEVAVAASWAGAYTTNHPTLITISSVDKSYQGMASVEMLFHEASHSLDGTVNEALAREAESRKVLFQRRGFSHAVLFYTVGEVARRHLGADYQPYGFKHGTLEGGWPGSPPVLEKDWKPYLEGRISFAEAVRASVRDYGVPKP